MSSCTKCGTEMSCGAKNDETSCWCANVTVVKPIPPEYVDCLCLECLKEFIQPAPARESETDS